MKTKLKKSSLVFAVALLVIAIIVPISAVLAVDTSDYGSITIEKVAEPQSDIPFEFRLDSPSKPNLLQNWGSQGTAEGQFDWTTTGMVFDANSNLYVADELNHRIQKFDSDGNFLMTWGKSVNGGAGSESCTSGCLPGIAGTGEGEFDGPVDVAIDFNGNIYVVDSNNQRIQKFDDDFVFVIMWGYGVDDGSNTLQTCTSDCQAGIAGTSNGQFSDPHGIGAGKTGDFIPAPMIYVVDRGNNRFLVFDGDGAYQGKLGSLGTTDSQFNDPVGLTVGPTGNVIIADRLNYRIQEFASTGEFIKALGWGVNTGRNQFEVCSAGCQSGISGTGDGQFSGPFDISTDVNGYVYAVDNSQNTVQKFDSSGNFIDKWGTSGSADGELNGPAAIAFDPDDQLYVADVLNYRIQKFAPTSFSLIDPEESDPEDRSVTYDLPPDTYTITEIIPNLWEEPVITCETDDTGDDPTIDGQSATISLDANEVVSCTFSNLYIEGTIIMEKEADPANGQDFKFWFGDPDHPTSLDDFGTRGSREAQFNTPTGLAMDSSQFIYVVDRDNNRVQKIDSTGTFSSTWGWGVSDGSDALQICNQSCQAGSYGSGTGQFDQPVGVAVDSLDNVYVVDRNNHRIQKFDVDHNHLLSWGSVGTAEGAFNLPNWIAVDASDNVYVVDQGNNRVQVFDSTGTFSTTWGWGVDDGTSIFQICTSGCQDGIAGSGDGQFNSPEGIAIDSVGNVFIVDGGNDRVQVFDLNGNYLDKWGSAGSGDGQFTYPAGAATDANDFVYISDPDTSRFQKFEADGTFVISVGNPPGSSDDVLNLPYGLVVDSDGGIYVSEMGNHRVNLFKPYIFYLDDGFDLDMIGKDLRYTGPIGPITITEEIEVEGWVLTSIDCTTTNPDIEPVVTGMSVFVDLERDDEVHCIWNNLLPDPVAADFEGTPTSGPHPLAVDFTNLSTGDFDTCSWDFGDGGTSDVCEDPSYTFNTAGVYTTSLTASGWGGEGTETKFEYITVYTSTIADFSATPTTGIAPLTVDFTNLSTGDFNSCYWEFGDGSTSTNCEDPSYTFNTPGVFTATLTASGFGGEDTETKTEYITVYDPVIADFSGTPINGGAPLTVDFTNLSTGDFDTCSWTFGDGGTSDICEDPSHEFTELGTFTVTLDVSGLGGTDTITKTEYIGVYVAVNADFSATPTSGVAPLGVDFTDLSTGNYDTCSWDFGDGGTSDTCEDPSYTFNASGVYTITLTASGLGGEDTETKTDYITVYEPVNAEFSGTPTSGIAPIGVDFTNTSTGDYDTCSWDFGDGGTSTSCADPSYTFNTAGIFTVTLTVSGLGGEDTESKTNYITVYDPVSADFSGTPTTGIGSQAVDFTNQSSGDYDTCSWTFGDGGTSDNCGNPSHTYNNPGAYTVELTVSGLGGEDTETKTNYIVVYTASGADFSGTPTSGGAPLSVNFTNLSSGDYDTCSWDFGDDSTSDSCGDPSHIYTEVGFYTVSLTVSGGGGGETETKTNYIAVYTAVNADFSGTPTSGIAPYDVDFTDLSTGEYDTCSWTFGDGGTSDSCEDPSYTYTTSGVYTVTLTASGLGGEDTETKTDYITVYEPVKADFSGTPTSGIAPFEVDFTDLSAGDYDTCSWTYGDGDTSDSCEDPSHTFTVPGVYTVSLNISGLGGSDTETKTEYISVYTAVDANFSATPTTGFDPLSVKFTNLSSGDYSTCLWMFGDGKTSDNCNDPTHVYVIPGVYTVSLTVSGFGGEETKSMTDYITVEKLYRIYQPLMHNNWKK